MGDTEIFGGGVFISLWLVTFFAYSAYQLRRTYVAPARRALSVIEPGGLLALKAPVE